MRGKKCEKPCKHEGQRKGGGRGSTYKHQGLRHSSAAHGGDGGAGSLLQPMERTMVQQISILQISILIYTEDPMPELVDTSIKICGLWRARGGEGLS